MQARLAAWLEPISSALTMSLICPSLRALSAPALTATETIGHRQAVKTTAKTQQNRFLYCTPDISFEFSL